MSLALNHIEGSRPPTLLGSTSAARFVCQLHSGGNSHKQSESNGKTDPETKSHMTDCVLPRSLLPFNIITTHLPPLRENPI